MHPAFSNKTEIIGYTIIIIPYFKKKNLRLNLSVFGPPLLLHRDKGNLEMLSSKTFVFCLHLLHRTSSLVQIATEFCEDILVVTPLVPQVLFCIAHAQASVLPCPTSTSIPPDYCRMLLCLPGFSGGPLGITTEVNQSCGADHVGNSVALWESLCLLSLWSLYGYGYRVLEGYSMNTAIPQYCKGKE